jgi:hypothetical protein
MPKPRKPRAKPTPGSLLTPESTGGITATKGFDFQTRYAACQLPLWLLDAPFDQLFYEGTGDIDIRYQELGKTSRLHIQVKDHEVTQAEFKQVIAHFQSLDAGLPGIYKCFRLVCPALAAKLRPLESGLARYRNAKPFYDDAPDALGPTEQELDGRIRALGFIADDAAFIVSKMFFEVGHGDLRHDDRAVDLFVARLLKHPEYAEKIRAAVLPAFAGLLHAIQANRGAVLARADVEKILRAAVASVAKEEKSFTIWIQNWTHEAFDVPADYELDWSAQFDRSTRKVPPEDVWNKQLIPEMLSLKEKIAVERSERLIRFRGKCTLSTGIALGVTFPAVGGWSFEIPQPPAKEAWRSDAESITPYDLPVEIIDGEGTDLVLGLNIRGDGREDVRRYIASTGVPPKLFAFVAPAAPGSQSISGSSEARAFAHAVREQLGQLTKSHGIKSTRLFFYGPFALAVFLGQQLTSVGEIKLFEYQDPGYVPTCRLRT